MEVRKHHTLLDICRTPGFAAEVTIAAAERLGVDAAIIFADLLLPLAPMGVEFDFVYGEGPTVQNPLRTLDIYEFSYPQGRLAHRYRHYVICGEDRSIHPVCQRIAGRSLCETNETVIGAGHCPQISKPHALADLILNIAASARTFR